MYSNEIIRNIFYWRLFCFFLLPAYFFSLTNTLLLPRNCASRASLLSCFTCWTCRRAPLCSHPTSCVACVCCHKRYASVCTHACACTHIYRVIPNCHVRFLLFYMATFSILSTPPEVPFFAQSHNAIKIGIENHTHSHTRAHLHITFCFV